MSIGTTPDHSAIFTSIKMSNSVGSYIPGAQVVQGQGPLKDFVFTEKLGSGTYATVYKAFRTTPNRETVAIKVVDKKTLNRASTENLLTEIEILKTMKHEHIVELRDFVWDEHYIYLVMEYCSGGDLSRFIKKKKVLPEFVAKYCLQQIASALKFLRENNVSHLDLKPQNILLSSKDSPTLKLADFGFAQHLDDRAGKKGMRGSPLYMAPEILLQNRYDASVDLWSVGVILYESLFGRAPFASESYQQLAEKIKKTKPIEMPANVRLSEGCRDLLSRLLQRDPKERISFEEFFDHPWVDLEHMPSQRCMGKGIALVKKAVEQDEARNIKDAVRLYCQALEYLVPATYYESDQAKKEAIRKKTRQYMERAEALKGVLSQLKSMSGSDGTVLEDSNTNSNSKTESLSDSSKEDSSATPQTDDTSASSGNGNNGVGAATISVGAATISVGAVSLGAGMRVDYNVSGTVEIPEVPQLLDELGKMTISSQNSKLQAALTVIKAAQNKAANQEYQAALEKYELALGALIPLMQKEDNERKKTIMRQLVSHWMAEAEEIKEVIQVTTVHQKVESEREEEEMMATATKDLCLLQ